MKIFSLFLLSALLTACSKTADDMGELTSTTSSPQVESQPTVPTTPEKIGELKKYVYAYPQDRDPFTPLIGEWKMVHAASGDQQSILTDLANLELKGILRDQRGKVALIGSSSGESYTLRSGRIYDRRNRIINEVTGIIKEKSIVLITQNKAVKELPLIKKQSDSSTAK